MKRLYPTLILLVLALQSVVGFTHPLVLLPDSVTVPDTTVQFDTACFEYTWTVNNMTYDTSGTYIEVFSDSTGCDSVVVLELQIDTVNTQVVQYIDGPAIALAQNATYQWLSCPDLQPVPGATSDAFAPADSAGDYAVAIVQNGCADTSECAFVHLVGLDDQIVPQGFEVFPNPSADGLVRLQWEGAPKEVATWMVFSATGQLVSQGSFVFPMDLQLPETSGFYLIRVETDERSFSVRVLRQ